MTTEVTLLSAFLLGLMGSMHCVGMCGGIVSAFTLGLEHETRRRPGLLLVYLAAYNSGRVASYSAAGAIAGALGAPLILAAAPTAAGHAVQWLSAAFMIALGLYLGGWWPGLQRIEQWGGHLWVRIQPLGRKLLPVNHPLKALGFGFIWGWIPCGLVYTALVWSLASGSATDGALRMLSFGLGTLPMLLVAGVAAQRLAAVVRQSWFRRGIGIAILGLGVFLLVQSIVNPGAHHHPPPASAPERHVGH